MTTTNLYLTFETPYNPAEAGLTVEAWPASLFAHSPVGNPGAYPPAPSPTATTTTDSSGNCELTGLTAGTDYYASIIDVNNKPWFLFCPAAYLGNLGTSRRRLSINPDASAAKPTTVYTPYIRVALIGSHAITTATLVPWDTETAENGATLALNSSNAVDAPAGPYYNVNAHVDFQAGAAKFVAGDLLTVSLYCGATFLSSTTVAPPTGATKFSVEATDTYMGGAYSVQATLTSTAGTTVTALAESHMTIQAIPNIVLGS